MDNGGLFTDRLLEAANIQPGQKILDVGCGHGDVSLRLAKLVGSNGQVVGIDHYNAALETARARAAGENLTNIRFEATDLHHLTDEDAFDIVTCRRVLMYLPDKIAAIKAMLKTLKPGGQLVLQEHSQHIPSRRGHLPLHEKANSMLWDTVRAEGADTDIGTKLYTILENAGAQQISIMAEGVIATPDEMPPTAMLIDVLRERMIASGVASQDDLEALDIPNLKDRLAQELKANATSFISEMIFGARAIKA